MYNIYIQIPAPYLSHSFSKMTNRLFPNLYKITGIEIGLLLSWKFLQSSDFSLDNQRLWLRYLMVFREKKKQQHFGKRILLWFSKDIFMTNLIWKELLIRVIE